MSAFPPRGFSIGPGPAGTFGSRRLKRQNLTTFLRERELGNFNAPVAPPNVHLAKHRHVYWIIYPRRTLYDVQLVHDHQHIVLRKFSPDGKYLLCFSKNQHAVSIFRYTGPGYADSDIVYPPGQTACSDDVAPTTEFSRFFEFASETTLTFGNELLCKDFSLFSEDKRVVILASAVPCGTTAPEARRSPSSLSILPSLDDVTFWTVSMDTGKVLDKITFKGDFVYLSHMAGVHFYDGLLAVTSVQHQTIHVLEVSNEGKFSEKRSIGWLTRQDDAEYLERSEEEAKEVYRQAQARAQAQAAALSFKRPRSVSPTSAGSNKRPALSYHDLSSETIQASSAEPIIAFENPEPGPADTPPAPEGAQAPSPRVARRQATVRLARFEPYPSASSPSSAAPAPIPGPGNAGAATPARQWSSSWATANGNRVASPGLINEDTQDQQQQQQEQRDSLPSRASAESVTEAGEAAGLVSTPAIPPTTPGPGRSLSAPTSARPSILGTNQRPPSAPPSQPPQERQIELPSSDAPQPEESHIMSGLKQRILSYLYRNAVGFGLQRHVRHFHLVAGMFSKLVMWRCQFLDADKLLLKFGAEENVVGKADPPVSQTAFFVIYEISSTNVLGVYESTSDDLLHMYETNPAFRGVPFLSDPAQFVPAVANSLWARETAARQMHAVWKAKNGGALASVKRILSSLPHNPQSHNESPYFDPSLYSYDEKTSGSWERPKLTGEFLLRFWNRATGEKKFELDPFEAGRVGTYKAKRFATVIFHPTDPFAVSVLFAPNQGTVVNFHVR